MVDNNFKPLLLLPFALLVLWLQDFYSNLDLVSQILFWASIGLATTLSIAIYYCYFSLTAKAQKKKLKVIHELPIELLAPKSSSVLMGIEANLETDIYLPDNIRTRHIHILGATGSGKTESVILNFLKQDISRNIGSIILDAKGDNSFLEELTTHVPKDKLLVFDLSGANSLTYDPIAFGSPLEASQRLFSSLTWSEEYYKSKALSCLQRIFQTHFDVNGKNPNLVDINSYLETPKSYAAFVGTNNFPQALAQAEFQDLSGLRDQIRSLTMGNLNKILSPQNGSDIDLNLARKGCVIYFRLQSLMSPQIVSILGRLVINHLNYLAGTAHRERLEDQVEVRKLVPVYFDEFASFACIEFADLISKARSAGFALHFAHQSIGDIMEVSPGFLNRITDNAATKIIMRINDPDSADFFARSFGTKDIQKTTHRITNAKDTDNPEIAEEGSMRDAHQFRAPPDLLKTLPTGMGAVLIAHGYETAHGASSVFTIRFPALN